MNFVKFSVAVAICGVTWFVGSAIIRSDNRVIIDVPQTVRTADTRTIAPKGPVTQKQVDDFIANLPTPGELGQPENSKPEEQVVAANEWRGGKRVIIPELPESKESETLALVRKMKVDSSSEGYRYPELFAQLKISRESSFNLVSKLDNRCLLGEGRQLIVKASGNVNESCWTWIDGSLLFYEHGLTDPGKAFVLADSDIAKFSANGYYLTHSLAHKAR